MIWADALQALGSVALGLGAVAISGDGNLGALWPVVGVAAFGFAGAVGDVLRWFTTRYRIGDDAVEVRSGILVRRHRSIRRQRIRSVDTDARLRHRLFHLRVVRVGAGQQAAAGESALTLNAVTREHAQELQRTLLGAPASILGPARAASGRDATDTATAPAGDDGGGGGGGGGGEVYARLRPSWVLFNIFNIWAYAMALGLLWGAYWLLVGVGVDATGIARTLVDPAAVGMGWSIAIAAAVVGAIGVVGLTVNFFGEYWDFELARVPGAEGTLLRTRRGLLRTREVNRDDRRLRGIQVAEPLLWRWIGMADTSVITTGLSRWSLGQPATILPRGPIGVARDVAAKVVPAGPVPLLEVPLRRHPLAALRRRLGWVTGAAMAAVGVLAGPIAAGAAPAAVLWCVPALWAIGLGGVVVAYRALGHAIAGDHLVVRAGLMTRTTAALRRDAVSTIAIRRSPFQRRLGLATVAAMTAAGAEAYDARDLDAHDAVQVAALAAPGLLDPFLAAPVPTAPDGPPE